MFKCSAFTIEMKTITTLFFVQAFVFAPYVSAHGYVSVLAVDGTPYKGQEPTEDGQSNIPSVVRRISTIDPVKGASNPFLNCGQNATSASLVSPTNPGSALTFQWEAGGGEGVSPPRGFLCPLKLTFGTFSGHITWDH
jgi:hypothetical protein